ncbi:MAG: hypothetical protein NVV82_03820 [Sporocytophaga sp.]|nr:hypothetical protein [Sporocytophaga sp.]
MKSFGLKKLLVLTVLGMMGACTGNQFTSSSPENDDLYFSSKDKKEGTACCYN